ncbi:cyclic nucleotide-binding domain-containing protein [Deltaproteobacteria bacterium TL4]
MRVKDKVSAVLNLRDGERSITLLLFLYSFQIGITKIFCLTSSLTIFLERYSANYLSYVYMLTAVVTVITGITYLKVSQHLSNIVLTLSNLGFITIVTVLIRLGLELPGVKWPAMALSVWNHVVFTLTNIAFWNIASKILDVRQGKRLFALIATGDVLAALFGGFATGFLAEMVGTPNLLIFSAAGTMGTFLELIYLKQKYRHKFAISHTVSSDFKREKSKLSLRTPYVLLIMSYFILSNFIYTFVDKAFNEMAQQRYSDSATLAQFFGNFFAVAAVLAVVIRIFVAGRLINRYGVVIGLMALPAAIFLGSSLTTVSVNVWGSVGLLFWFTIMTRLFDKVFRGIQYASMATIYQPLMDQSQSIQASMESFVEPLTIGAAGVFLFLIHAYFDISALELAYFCGFLSVVWILITLLLRNEYITVLAQAITHRKIEAVEFSLKDESTLALLEKELKSPFHENVIYALDLLESIHSKALLSIFTQLLEHPSIEVRKNVLERIEKHHAVELLEAINARIKVETSMEVKGLLLHVFCVLSEDGVPQNISYLNHESPWLRMGAFTGLLRSGSIEGIVHAGSKLMDLLNSAESTDRIFAAQILERAAITEFYRPVLQLLMDPDFKVRKAALAAASKLKNPLLWHAVAENLQFKELSSSVVSCLISVGSPAIVSLEHAFEKNKDNEAILIRILRIVGIIGGPEAIEFLNSKSEFNAEDVRHAAILALKNCRYHVSLEMIPSIEKKIRNEIDDAAWTFAALKDFAKEESAIYLKKSLEYEIDQNRERIFVFLSFIYDRDTVLQAWDNYLFGDSEKKSYALELIDNLISNDLKKLIFPVLEDLLIHIRMDRLKPYFPQSLLGGIDRAREILIRTDKWITTWTKCCTLYWVGKQKLMDLAEAVIKNVSMNCEPLVQETAIWALTQLQVKNLEEFLQPLTLAKSETLAKQAQAALSAKTLDLTVERVLKLKTIEMFDQTPETILAEIALLMEEQEYPAGHTLFREGDQGDSMYIILEGSVQLRQANVILGTLGPNQIFGEFAILSSRPRSATVLTLEPTRLFRLHQDILYQLLSENLKLAKGLIHVLCEKLRRQQNF